MPKTLTKSPIEAPAKPDREPRGSIIYTGALKRAVETANFYGFKLITPPEPRGNHKRAYKEDDFYVPEEEKLELLERFSKGEFGSIGLPAMVCYTKRNPVKKSMHLRLDIIGSSKSVAEALLLSAAIAIVKENGTKNAWVDINNIGDKDALASYLRDLTSFFRKNIESLDAKCRDNLKKDVLKIFACKTARCQELREESPKSLSYLSELSRTHFKEVIEFIENLDITYQIENTAVSNSDYSNKTIFEIREYDKEEDIYNAKSSLPVARGSRYDGLSKKTSLKKNVPAVGITIKFDGVPLKESYKKGPTVKDKIKVFLVQFGFAAKLRSLRVMEMFRHNKVPVTHALMKDDLGSQLALTEKAGVPYIVIIGQKEVVDNTVMIRNTWNRSQDSIPLSQIGNYLKEELKKI